MIRNIIVISLICLTGICFGTSAEAKSMTSSNKFGAVYTLTSGATYTLMDTANGELSDDSTLLNGTTLFYEFFLNEQFSLGLSYSIFGGRYLQLEIGSDTYEIIESSTYYLLDFKSYFFTYSDRGLNPYFGVSQGTFSIQSEITKTDSTGTETNGSTKAEIPTNFLTVGMEYSMENTGFKLEYSLLRGKRNDSISYSGHKATYSLVGSSVLGMSVFVLF
ncbi:MAG: hypothetical protein HQ517_10005 [SAR324 cluster bacterium]|nr:hypothetical protein [SAR324 cluster bacterium]